MRGSETDIMLMTAATGKAGAIATIVTTAGTAGRQDHPDRITARTLGRGTIAITTDFT